MADLAKKVADKSKEIRRLNTKLKEILDQIRIRIVIGNLNNVINKAQLYDYDI